MTKRVALRITGPSIIHVGYRDYVESIANELQIVGTVQNMTDKSVQIICEAEEEVLRQFITEIQIREEKPNLYRPRILVDKVEQVAWDKTKGEFTSFSRVYSSESERQQNAAEELTIGRKAVVDMAANFGSLANGAKSLTEEMKAFRKETSSGIQYIAERYHVIAMASFAILAAIAIFGLYLASAYSNIVQPGLAPFISVVVILAIVWIGIAYVSLRRASHRQESQAAKI